MKKELSFHQRIVFSPNAAWNNWLSACKKKKKENVLTIPTSQRTQKLNLKWSINLKVIKFKNFWGKYL